MEAYPGRLYLVTGVNGSGKSTLLRVMAGLSRLSAGVVHFLGHGRIALLGHATFLYGDLTADQNLRFWASAEGISCSASDLKMLLEKVELLPYAEEKVRIFSRGMAQRLNFARCLLLRPSLLLLDEPFTGLDRRSMTLMRQELAGLKESGTCIVQVSHDPYADSHLADQLYILAGGQLRHGEKSPC